MATVWALDGRVTTAQPITEAAWSDGFAAPAFDNTVRAFTMFEGQLVAAGDFRRTPDGRAEHVAVWNGVQWTPLGDGIALPVSALFAFGDTLIAGVVRSWPGLAPVISRWDGARWTRMDAGLLGPCRVAALGVYQDQFVTCGDLSFDGLGHYLAARWDGEEWRPMGSVLLRYDLAYAKAMTLHEGRLVIGGRFQDPRDTTAALVLRWADGVWDTLAIGTVHDEVDALASQSGMLYAGGSLDGFSGGSVARWDGKTWRRLSPFGSGVVRTLRLEGDAIVAGGRFNLDDGSVQSVVRWRGASLDSFPGLQGAVLATADLGLRLEVGGEGLVSTSGLAPGPLLCGQWNGEGWEPIGDQPSGAGLIDLQGGLVAALRSEGDTLFVGGRFEFARDGERWIPVANVARWDGAHWSAMGFEITGTVTAFARYRGELIAAGAFEGGSGDQRIENIARWDGLHWRPLGRGIRGYGSHGYVLALLVAGDSLVAAGQFDRAGDVTVNEIAAWNGESWAPIGPVYADAIWAYPSLSALAIYDEVLLAAAGPTSYGWPRLVMRWSGTEWERMNVGLNVSVAVLQSHQGQLIAGGPGGLVKWDGSQWIPFADQVPAEVRALELDGETLYVGGRFEGVGTVHSPGIVKWTGSGWQALGSGLEPWKSSPALAVARFHDGLYVGGDMATAGGNPSSLIARWGEPERGPQATVLALAPGRPNPFTHEVSMPFSLAESERVEVFILDLAGRRVKTLIDRHLGAGPHAAVWDGLDEGGRRSPPGVYYVAMRVAGEVRSSRKVVLLH